MYNLLHSEKSNLNAKDAGTVMRFMTAYLAVTQNNVQITGTERMKKRPISILVDALNSLGAEINYLEKKGFPPLQINKLAEQINDTLEIDSDVSSQYISALLMIAPILAKGLTIKLKGEQVSKPYIDMTLSIMRHFGVSVDTDNESFQIKPQSYTYIPYEVESDWSRASYWYSIFALSDLHELQLNGLKEHSNQGDSVVAQLMEGFGVRTEFVKNTAILTKGETWLPRVIDFIECPDLAQTFAVLCAVLGHQCYFSGLQTLRIKETDRIEALKTELQKLGANFIEEEDKWTLLPIPNDKLNSINSIAISTYNDHRMALAFSALATNMDVELDNGEVINKSYPDFWHDMKAVGFNIDSDRYDV
jgi:3-phosphoshikimate 1-carboxyvinyltransferase